MNCPYGAPTSHAAPSRPSPAPTPHDAPSRPSPAPTSHDVSSRPSPDHLCLCGLMRLLLLLALHPLDTHRTGAETGADGSQEIDADDISPEARLLEGGVDQMLDLRVVLRRLAP